MRFKNVPYLTFLSLKATAAVVLTGLALVAVVTPVINYGNFKMLGNSPELLTSLVHTARRLIPFAAVLPPVMIMRLYAESDCRETFCIYTATQRFAVALGANAVTVLCSGLLFICYSALFGLSFIEFFKTAVISFMLFCAAYSLMFLIRSCAVTMLIITVYEVYLIASSSSVANYVLLCGTAKDSPGTYAAMTGIGLLAVLLSQAVQELRKKIA